MLRVTGLMSTNTTCAPAIRMASDVATKLLATVITSSPGPIPSVRNAMNNASVPFATPTQCPTSQYCANASSKAFTNGPLTNAVSEMTAAMAASISGLIDSY